MFGGSPRGGPAGGPLKFIDFRVPQNMLQTNLCILVKPWRSSTRRQRSTRPLP